MRAHDPAAAHGARRPVEIRFAKSEPGQNPLRLRLELPAAVFVEDVQRVVMLPPNPSGVVFMMSLRLRQLRANSRIASSSTVSSPAGAVLLRQKSDRGRFLERHRAVVRRRLAENERKERRLSRAIRTDQPDAIAAIHLERHVFKENSSGERFGDL